VAQDANKISKTSSELAYRPYVGAEGAVAKYQWMDAHGELHVSDTRTKEANQLIVAAGIKNFGPVPGINFMPHWRLFLNGIEIEGQKGPDTPHTIFPGQSVSFLARLGTTDFPHIMDGTKILAVEITIIYDGPSGHYEDCGRHQFDRLTSKFMDLGACTSPKSKPPN